jgi:transcription antitermination factor NusA-like protein
MKFPICKACLKNELLCDKCARNVGDNLIKIDEIKMYRTLNRVSKKFSLLKDVEIQRVINAKKVVLILANKENASKIIGKEGGMVERLSKSIGKQIRVVSEMSTLEDFVEEIFYSTPIIGINVIYGEKDQYKVKIPSSEKDRLPIKPEKFSKVVRSILTWRLR